MSRQALKHFSILLLSERKTAGKVSKLDSDSVRQFLLDGVLAVGFNCSVDGEEVSHIFPLSEINHISDEYQRVSGSIGGNLTLKVEFSSDFEHGICHCRGSIGNSSATAVSLVNPTLELVFRGTGISVRAQKSTWCRESQFVNVEVPISIGSKGRTCSGFAPYIGISSESLGDIVIHILPTGDWRAALQESEDTLSIALDRYEENESIKLQPDEEYELKPECLFQHAAIGQSEKEGYRIQAYAADRLVKLQSPRLPVVYDTWFDRFYKISISSLVDQLDAAAEIGCEVFVVDAGWYGAGGGNWHEMIGDWRENPDVFSEHTMSWFADLVRSKGLQFGIWMEPERVHASAPIRIAHPDWFIASDQEGYYYPDLQRCAARDWVLAEMRRIIDTYSVKWLDIDCNFDFSDDPYHTGHRLRTDAWHAILDKIAEDYPDLMLEGCASGGLRNDLSTLSHYHTHFLTDTVDPIDTIRIGMSSTTRLSPAMTFRWAVLYPTGGGFTPYSRDPGDTGDVILCPSNATCDRVSSYYLDFAVRSAMTGGLGFGGNIAGLSDDLQRQLGEHVAYYKKHREFILSSVAIPLTSIEPIEKRDGVSAVQLSSRDFERNMIFVYNMSSDTNSVQVKPLGLLEDAMFSVCFDDETLCGPILGADAATEGIRVDCELGRSRVVEVDFLRTNKIEKKTP
ncbi:MAG: glycoside hydrolase family 36 protein [Armatimonadota bacterium]